VQYNLGHYLPLLEKKPRAVWNARPVKAMNLPPTFWDYAKRLNTDYEVVKVLTLLSQYGLEALLESIKQALSIGAYCYEALRTILERRQFSSTPAKPISDPVESKQVDLNAYDLMLAGGVPIERRH
jgi:hypothetical protein